MAEGGHERCPLCTLHRVCVARLPFLKTQLSAYAVQRGKVTLHSRDMTHTRTSAPLPGSGTGSKSTEREGSVGYSRCSCVMRRLMDCGEGEEARKSAYKVSIACMSL